MGPISERLILVGDGDLVGLLDVTSGPVISAQDALITSVIELVFFSCDADIVSLGENRVSLARIECVAPAVFITAALIAGSKALE